MTHYTSWFRRVPVMLAHNILLLVLLSITIASTVSSACLDRNVCSSAESFSLSVAGLTWLGLAVLSIALGCTGRLPGCRPRKPI